MNILCFPSLKPFYPALGVLLFWAQMGFAQNSNCLRFDGVNDQVTSSPAIGQTIGSGEFTVEAWIKGSEADMPTHGAILSNRTAHGVGILFGFHDYWGGSNHKMLFVQYRDINWMFIDNGNFDGKILDGTCHHVAATFGGNVLSLYVDGQLIGNTGFIVNNDISTTNNFFIGRDPVSNIPFDGSISKVRVWSVGRTQAEIQQGMFDGPAGTAPGLLASWDMTEGTGQTVSDLTGQYNGVFGTSTSIEASDPSWTGECCGIPVVTCADNLIANPGFENGLAGWNISGNASLTTDANSGTSAAVMGNGYASVGYLLPTTPGTAYNLSAFAKKTGSPVSPSVAIRFLNTAFVTIPTPGTSTGTITTEYSEVTDAKLAPSQAAYVYVISSKDGGGSLTVDDWCLTTGGQTNLPDLTVSNLQVPSTLTHSVPFNFSILVKNEGTGASQSTTLLLSPTNNFNFPPLNVPALQPGEEITISQSLTYPGPISGSGVFVARVDPADLVDESNEFNNSINQLITIQQNSGGCAITASSSGIYCDDDGTPADPADDTFGFDLLANNTVSSSGYAIYFAETNETFNTGTYGNVVSFANLPIALGMLTVTMTDNDDPSCTETIVVMPPPTCSNGGSGGQIDLSLTLEQLTASPAQWNSYPVKLTVHNTGSLTATGVKVSFKKPAGVVYTGGNEFTASQGTFNAFDDELWTVGSIPAGGSATLTVNYFLLANAAPVAYAQVTAANEPDSDSTPDNGAPPTPNEDDEASTGSGPPPNFLDLKVENVLPIAGTVMPGDNLTGAFSIFYAGPFASVNFKYAAYLSVDPVLSADDMLINNQFYQVTSFPAGVPTPFQVNFTMPGSFPSGQVYFIAVVDPDNALVEANEGNNVGFNSFIFDNGTGGDLPDLTAYDLQIVNATLPFGSTGVIYNVGFANIGNTAVSSSFTFNYYISDDVMLSADDMLQESLNYNSFGVGQSSQVNMGISPLPGNLPPGTYYLILKIDADNAITESNEDNNTVAMPFTVSGGGTGSPCDNISVTSGPGNITIAGAAAPHILIKVFRPDWAVAFSCLDGACTDPLTVSGLGAGPHFVEIKLLDASWGEICRVEQTVSVNGSSSPLAIPDLKGRDVQLTNIYPNPVYFGEVTVEIWSKESGIHDLEVYDLFGRLVDSQKIELEKGKNDVRMNVSDYRSGTYYLNMPGENWKYMPVRFVVARW